MRLALGGWVLLGLAWAAAGCGISVDGPGGILGCPQTCGVDQTCVNRTCVCADGFEEGDEVGACVDVDECARGDDNCDPQAVCTNLEGGFSCACGPGFSGDGESCEDVDECASSPCDALATCTNTVGSFACLCPDGFSGDGLTCTDVDECALELDDCSPQGICTNLPGAFECACLAGFVGDGRACTDVDECEDNTNNCDQNATCTNIAGSFECACMSGYEGNGVTCTDIDECSGPTPVCDENATCTNQDGGFDCACNAGFDGNGVVCVDVDECSSGVPVCDENATCTNQVGGFDCACNAGYQGDGQTCADIDECTEGTANCSPDAVCTNEPGTFSCACNSGFAGNGVSCTDIDECANGTDNCDANATCSNTPGSFDCTCNSGFTGNGVTCTPAFDIVLSFAQTPSTQQRQAFERAEQRWEGLITGDLADISSVPTNCRSVAGGASTIDDLVIRVELVTIDGPGGILGQAGPVCVRNTSGGDFLPFVGRMRFDTADAQALINQGRFEAVVLHEMGHVLGVGPGWSSLLSNPSCNQSGCVTGRDTRYTGANGVAAWQSLGGTGNVPVENSRGPGSSDSHWREAGSLRFELMSPILSSANALSIITLRSLVDLGYQVAPNSAADSFTLAPILGGPLPPPLDLHNDALGDTVYELVPGGVAPLP